MLPTSSALRSNVSAAMVAPPWGQEYHLELGGLEGPPNPPERSERPGEPGALLYEPWRSSITKSRISHRRPWVAVTVPFRREAAGVGQTLGAPQQCLAPPR